MKSLTLCIILVGLSLAALSCAFQSKTVKSTLPAPQKTDISHLITSDLSFAKDFVQLLGDDGWTIHEVRNSKFNSFFADSGKAAYIKTDKGVLDVIFFQSKADVKQIQVSEEQTGDSHSHRYIVKKLPATNQRIEGGNCYFTKYRNAFIITTDRQLNDELSRLPE